MNRYEVYDCNDEVVDESDNLLNAQIAAEFEGAKFILDTQTGKRTFCLGSIAQE